jgi:uncharacterized protein YfaP (DUF2135 family)
MSLLVAVLLLSGAADEPAVAPEPTVLSDPRAGWRSSTGPTGFVQPVHYPASSVTSEEAEELARVAGRVAANGKAPATLVVDGVPMPVEVEEDGSFARPWSFGTGSHAIEVRGEGVAVARRQFYEAGQGRTPVRLRVLLSWDTDATDVDLHVVGPTGEHTYYGDRVAPSGGALDIDVTTGFGPEIYANPSPPEGVYHVYVNYYGAGDRPDDEITVAQVTVLIGEGTPREKREQFTVPLRKPGELTRVHAFVYP